jgi:anaerobic selenocysteine-containing dehydrogenase
MLARPKLVDPPGEAWSDLRIALQLGKALGLEEFAWKDEAELLDQVLEPSGLDYSGFQEQGVLWGKKKYFSYRDSGFKTPSGKVELYAEKLAAMGLDPLPSHTSPRKMPDTTAEYPLVLTSAKNPVFFHSAYRQLETLRKISPDPVVEIAPEAAQKIGVGEGDWVRICTEKGEIRQRARLAEGMDPRVIVASYGWWFPERGEAELFGWKESNLNVLISGEPPYDPLTGTVNLRAVPCRMEKE